MRGIKFLFHDGGHFYNVEIVLVRVWDYYGVHICRQGVRVYRHKDQDFKTLRKLETVFAPLDKLYSDKRPFGQKIMAGVLFSIILIF